MRYISVCSGIEAASVAWAPLGWEPVAFAEIDPFPIAVLAHHYPDVPNVGDITKVNWSEYHGKANVVIGGTPCQSFSLAGNRKGLDDPRGQLALAFVRLVEAIAPEWFIWENVPGVLSANGGRDFQEFCAALDGIGYHIAWRVLDAQHFGVPQRRRRIFLVGHSTDWRCAAKVLFERDSLQGNITQIRSKRESVAEKTRTSTDQTECYWINSQNSFSMNSKNKELGFEKTDFARTLTTGNCDPSSTQGGMCVVYNNSGHLKFKQEDVVGTLTTDAGHRYESILFNETGHSKFKAEDVCGTLRASGGSLSGGSEALVYENNPTDGRLKQVSVCPTVLSRYGTGGNQIPLVQSSPPSLIRRLTPLECERLQGFSDHYTRIPYRKKSAEDCPDSPRYKAIGNSMCVQVVRWIGERIQGVNNGTI